MSNAIKTIEWADGKVLLLDQTRLPKEQVILEISDHRQMIEAIKSLRIRGAPALGVAAAYGIVLGALAIPDKADKSKFLEQLRAVIREVVDARPTAVNMAWAAARMDRAISGLSSTQEIKGALIQEAARILEEDIAINRAMGMHGAALIPDNATVLTHCNTGSLATAGYGTALGVLRAAREQGKNVRVFATETRPLLQGARLTAWELVRDGFEATLITDSMAGHFLHSGKIDCAIVGADRIAMNGDVANKIGTYSIAVLAKENSVPFYVAAPTSTIDPRLATGDGIPIEQRSAAEVLQFHGVRSAPEGVAVANPAFDVTPNRYVGAIITERGVARPPFGSSLKAIMERT